MNSKLIRKKSNFLLSKMPKDVDFTSKEWCDIIFRGKNKKYGAYYLRVTSSYRHGKALVVVMSALLVLYFPIVTEKIIDESRDPEIVEIVKKVEVELEKPKPEKEQPVNEKVRLARNVHVMSAPMMQMASVEVVKEDGVKKKSDGEKAEGEGSSGGGDMGQFNSSLKDSKGTNADDIYAEAERVMRELAEGNNYNITNEASGGGQRGGGRGKGGGSGSGSSGTGAGGSGSGVGEKAKKPKGNVLVTYELDGRSHRYLHTPAYTCEFGGHVTVNITVDRSGNVISAVVDKKASSSDGCLESMSLQSARISKFSASNSAPDKQKGKIMYTFVSQ